MSQRLRPLTPAVAGSVVLAELMAYTALLVAVGVDLQVALVAAVVVSTVAFEFVRRLGGPVAPPLVTPGSAVPGVAVRLDPANRIGNGGV